uniref:Uncharacterized protein At4g26480 family n=1 Tax=Cajanus cajan TaxID=3821 RepID=A0A151R9Q8_CAJCA|nr:Uncharacterized protein At4g26480 family [Cajanus cajan]
MKETKNIVHKEEQEIDVKLITHYSNNHRILLVGKEGNTSMIKMHKALVLGFLKNASCMLRADGEIHIRHKITFPYTYWNIEELGAQSSLKLIEKAELKK